jgi:hypothetical protein
LTSETSGLILFKFKPVNGRRGGTAGGNPGAPVNPGLLDRAPITSNSSSNTAADTVLLLPKPWLGDSHGEDRALFVAAAVNEDVIAGGCAPHAPKKHGETDLTLARLH